MSGGARRKGIARRRAGTGVARFRSPLTALAVALSLIIQLLAIPYHQALSAPAFASDTAATAAELKATFGDAAALCVQVYEKSAPGAPAGHCDDQCPFCRFSAQAAVLIAPDAPALPVRLYRASRALGAAPAPGAVPAHPTSRNRARAPPVAV